jgi:hypothetical protein
VPIVYKSGSLNFLEPSRPVMGLLYLYLRGVSSCPEDGGSKFFINDGTRVPNYIPSHDFTQISNSMREQGEGRYVVK